MDERYLIENLTEIFDKHAKDAQAHHKKKVKDYEENFPNSEYPEWNKDYFNISRALSVMAKEINDLKEWMIDHMRNEHPFC